MTKPMYFAAAGFLFASTFVTPQVQSAQAIAQNTPQGLDLGVCSPEKMGTAQAGSTCTAGGYDDYTTPYGVTNPVVWRVEPETYMGLPTFRDLKSGKQITSVLVTNSNPPHDYAYVSDRLCSDGFHLPSGYPHRNNGSEGLPMHDSELQILSLDQFTQVVPHEFAQALWSATRESVERDAHGEQINRYFTIQFGWAPSGGRLREYDMFSSWRPRSGLLVGAICVAD